MTFHAPSENKDNAKALALLRSLVDRSNDAIEVIDPETGAYLDVNETAGAMLGYSREERLKLTVFDINPLYHHRDPKVWREQVENLRRAGSRRFERHHRHRDGTLIPVEINATYVSLDRDYIISIIRDISERKQAEKQIQRLNRLYSVLCAINETLVRERDPGIVFKNACRIAVEQGGFRMVWVGLVDEDRRILMPTAWAGYEEGYLKTINIDLTDPARNMGPCGRAVFSGEHQISHFTHENPRIAPWREAALKRGYRSSGSFPIKVFSQVVGALTLYAEDPEYFQSEEIRLLDELTLDIGFALEVNQRENERLRAEQALRASERQFAAAFEYAPIGKALVALDGKWIKVNHAFCEMIGYTAEEICAKTFQDVTHPEDLPADLDVLKKMLAGEKQTYQSEKRYVHKDGHIIWVLISSALVKDDQGQPLHFITQIQDVTGRRKMEEQLRQSQKMHAIGQLAGGVAHDFNNILAAVMMQAQLMETASNLPGEFRDGLAQITESCRRAANLTRQLLLFGRKQVFQRRNLNLNDVVLEVAQMLQRIIGEDYRLEINLHPRSLPTHADPGMLDQVLVNLVVNARDAMPNGGVVTIETGETILSPTEADSVPNAVPGNYTWLKVVDSGCGIPTKDLEHIFEPFFTTKGPGKGTGLGLATVFGIVQEHRGFISVESEVDRGSRFQVFLPLLEQNTVCSRATARHPTAQKGNELILLVEDEPALRSITKLVLRKAGYRILEAATGPEALRIWNETDEKIDLLLSDIVLPEGLYGWELGQKLREKNPHLKMVFVSGYSAETPVEEITNERGQYFLQKPYTPQELLWVIRRCLDN